MQCYVQEKWRCNAPDVSGNNALNRSALRALLYYGAAELLPKSLKLFLPPASLKQ